jgi:hypothetical protein
VHVHVQKNQVFFSVSICFNLGGFIHDCKTLYNYNNMMIKIYKYVKIVDC